MKSFQALYYCFFLSLHRKSKPKFTSITQNIFGVESLSPGPDKSSLDEKKNTLGQFIYCFCLFVYVTANLNLCSDFPHFRRK